MKSMMYVDGTNLLVEMGKYIQCEYRADKLPDLAIQIAHAILFGGLMYYGLEMQRRYWFGSYRGSEDDCLAYRQLLRRNSFEPVLFKKDKGPEKGVDICLTKQMLVNAFHGNCNCSVLIAGDEDYLSLVQETKRYNQQVCICFFKDSTAPELRLAADRFIELDDRLRDDNVKRLVDAFRTSLPK